MRGDTYVTPALDLPGRASDQEDRQRVMVVFVAVAQSAAVQNERVIKKRSIAIRCLLQFVEEVGQAVHVIMVENRELVHVLAVVRVVRRVMEPIPDTALRIDRTAC